MLRDSYFAVTDCQHESETHHIYTISLKSDHPVYDGHFPGNPVSPGVFSIQIIRECCEDATQKQLFIEAINQCRFLNVLTPSKGETLKIDINISHNEAENQYNIVASVADSATTFVSYKGTMCETK